MQDQHVLPTRHVGPQPGTLVLALPASTDAVALGGGARVVTEVAEFSRLLNGTAASVIVLFAPPAAAADIEAVAAIRRTRRGIRAVLVDHPLQTAERLAALRAGFDDAMDYEMARRELEGRLALLQERALQDHSAARLVLGGGATLDLNARALRVHGRPVHLRPREFALLSVLGRDCGRAFTREQLVAAVGAHPRATELRAIDVHIRWLRKKLESAGVNGVRLTTVRGVGYRLERGLKRPSALTGR